MNTTATTQATALEVLAPYLPYSIDVLWRTTNSGKPMAPYATTLKGYLPGSGFAVQRKGDIQRWAADDELLPILRSFIDLVTPLADGTVPAVAIAQLVVADDVFIEDGSAVLDDEDYDEDTDTEYAPDAIYVSGKDEFTGERIEVTIYSDWSCDQITYAPAAYIDYLRANHFAVGLEPHQFIRKS